MQDLIRFSAVIVKHRSVDRLGLGQTIDFFFGDPAFGAEHVETFETLHDIAFFADLTANAETGMLRHCYTSMVIWLIIEKILFLKLYICIIWLIF